MPFRRKGTEDKANPALEHKMYLVQARPDDKFDISACQLKEVPSATFALAKMLLKKTLLLNDNSINSLSAGGNLADLSNITQLDISSNRISRLPDDIGMLVKLQDLNVSDNELQDLPDSMKNLKQLTSLGCENNRINKLPRSICNLRQLQKLLLEGNPLKNLPSEVRFLTNLTVLTLPSENMVSPPTDHPPDDTEKDNDHFSLDDFVVIEKPQNYPTLPVTSNRSRPSDLPDLARQLDEATRAQQELANKAKLSQQKILSQLVEEKDRTQADLAEVQRRQAAERIKLLSTVKSAEDEAAQVIKELFAAQRNRRWIDDPGPNPLLQLPDEATVQLRRQEVLDSMKKTLAASEVAFTNYVAKRDSDNQASLKLSTVETKGIEKVLENRRRDQDRLTLKIFEEESMQREAFARLQSQHDEQFRLVVQDIATVEWELYRLTMLERRAADNDVNQACLDNQRADLVRLLEQLGEQRARREAQLQAYLVELEERRCQDQLDYWLVQYQRLLDSRPAQLSQPTEDRVHEILVKVNGLDFEPNFRYHQITFDRLKWMSDDDLRKIGVNAMGIRQGILDAVAHQVFMDKCTATKPKTSLREPEKPKAEATASGHQLQEVVTPSAPPEVVARITKECCICMAKRCDTIFMQCGHVCTCNECACRVEECPLCRAQIVQRIHLQGRMDYE